MAYLFFTSKILKGNSIPSYEAATHETIAVGAFEFVDKGTAGNNTIHIVELGAVNSLFDPIKFSANCKWQFERLDEVVNGAKPSLFNGAAARWFYKPRVKNEVRERKAREAWLHDSLWTRNLKGKGLLRSQIVEGKSPADDYGRVIRDTHMHATVRAVGASMDRWS